MDFTFKDSEIEKFADKVQFIPEWFQQFFHKIHKKDKSSEYYKGCFATLRFILKFRKSTDKDRVIFYSLPCLSKLILDKINNENEIINNDNDVDVEEMFKDLVLNINYVYKGNDDNIAENMDLDEMFKKMQENYTTQEKNEETEEKNDETEENDETDSVSTIIEIIEIDGDIIKDSNDVIENIETDNINN